MPPIHSENFSEDLYNVFLLIYPSIQRKPKHMVIIKHLQQRSAYYFAYRWFPDLLQYCSFWLNAYWCWRIDIDVIIQIYIIYVNVYKTIFSLTTCVFITSRGIFWSIGHHKFYANSFIRSRPIIFTNTMMETLMLERNSIQLLLQLHFTNKETGAQVGQDIFQQWPSMFMRELGLEPT